MAGLSRPEAKIAKQGLGLAYGVGSLEPLHGSGGFVRCLVTRCPCFELGLYFMWAYYRYVSIDGGLYLGAATVNESP